MGNVTLFHKECLDISKLLMNAVVVAHGRERGDQRESKHAFMCVLGNDQKAIHVDDDLTVFKLNLEKMAQGASEMQVGLPLLRNLFTRDPGTIKPLPT
jgi:hypothetical protein